MSFLVLVAYHYCKKVDSSHVHTWSKPLEGHISSHHLFWIFVYFQGSEIFAGLSIGISNLYNHSPCLINVIRKFSHDCVKLRFAKKVKMAKKNDNEI